MNRSDSTSTMTASGTFRKNTARQLTCSISQPPLTGPIAVVIALNPDQVPIARPRSASSNVALMIARLPGTRNAAPIPCSARPTMSIAGEVARPQSDRRGREEHDAEQEHALAAELIAHRSADQDQRAQEQRVGFDHPLHVGDRRVEVGLERGQRDVDDRRVDERHARPEDGRDERPSATGRRHRWAPPAPFGLTCQLSRTA